MKLTAQRVKNLPFPDKGQVFYWDDELKGFGIRVTPTRKTFVVQRRINGKIARRTIDACNVITATMAREEAKDMLYKMGKGEDPRKVEKKTLTLKDALEEYIATRKTLSPRTITDYRYDITSYLSDWLDKPLTDITREMVLKKHMEIGEVSQRKANAAMTVLGTIFNGLIPRYKPDLSENPTDILKETRAKFKEERRKTFIKDEQLPIFFECLDKLEETADDSCVKTIRDYILFLLFTGMRPGEAVRLRWEDVDFKKKLFILPTSKNKTPYALPLSDYLLNLLRVRYANKVNDYVFPGKDGYGHIIEPKRQLKNISTMAGIQFMLTDLRRTFITIAERMDLSYYAVKRLLNHKISGDVTAGYIGIDVERLRKPMQMITDYILRVANIKENAKVWKK